SGRQPGDVDATGVDTVIEHHLVDHLPDRESLTLSALRVAGLKPVEAAVRVVCVLLLRKKQREAIPLGECRPSGAVLITCRRLRASVKNDDEGGSVRNAGGQIREHTQGAGIGSETANLLQAARCLVEVGRSQTDLGGASHERLPLLTVVQQAGGCFSKTRHGETFRTGKDDLRR